MTASVRSVNVDSVNRLAEAVRIVDGFDMEKILRGGIRSFGRIRA